MAKTSDSESRPPRATASYQAWKHHILNTTAVNIYVNEMPRYVFFTHPGLNYSDFDRHGNPHLTNLMHLTNDTFSIAVQPDLAAGDITKSFMNWKELNKDRLIFVASTKFEISKAAYNSNIPKWPVDAKISFGGMRSTSFVMRYQLYPLGRQEPFLTRWATIVSIDPRTRKPMLLPDWLKNDLKGCEVIMSDVKVNKFPRPSNTFCERLKVMYLETDLQNHTNFASYVKYGLDTLHLALALKSRNIKRSQNHVYKAVQVNSLEVKATEGHPQAQQQESESHSVVGKSTQNHPTAVKWLTEENLADGVKSLEICYLQECVEGDVIDVHVWQEDDTEFVVKCSVEATDGTPLAQFILEYFSPSPHL